MSDLYAVLGVPRAADADAIKAAFRALALRFHPDKNPGNRTAEERFKEASAAHEVLSDPDRRARYDRLGTAVPAVAPSSVTLVIGGKTFILDGEPSFVGDLADVYHAVDGAGAEAAVKVGRHAVDGDLLLNEAKRLRTLFPANARDEKFYRYLPRVMASGKLAGGRVVTALPWCGEYHSLAEVRAAYPAGVESATAVWIFKRILAGLGFVHGKGVVHGAILPEHVLVHPVTHGAKLVDWSYSVAAGELVRALAAGHDDIYAPEISGKRLVSPSTDIYMAVRTVLGLLGADAQPWLRAFLQGCALENPSRRPNDAHALHEEFDDLVKRRLGPPKYHPFHMPPRAKAEKESDHGRK